MATADSATVPELDVQGNININVQAGDGFWADIDARFEYLWAVRARLDGGVIH